MANLDDTLIWSLRAFIYQQFVLTSRPPTVEEAVRHFELSVEQAASVYRDLNQRHALFLETGTTEIRIANPFSAVPTPFRVKVEGLSYWANCAWDALGIAAALHKDATIEATYGDTGQALTLEVAGGQVLGHDELVHFPHPFPPLVR